MHATQLLDTVSVSTQRDERTITFLAERIMTHMDLSPTRALEVAGELSATDDDIWQAALVWANTGTLPDSPLVWGHTPASLGQIMSPTLTLTSLMALRQDPEHTLLLGRRRSTTIG